MRAHGEYAAVNGVGSQANNGSISQETAQSSCFYCNIIDLKELYVK